MKSQLVIIVLIGLVSVALGGGILNSFGGQWYDSISQRTVHVCENQVTNELYIGVSDTNNPYFISGFGRGQFISSVTVAGSEMYLLENSGFTIGNFTFTNVNSTRWVGSFVPFTGPLIGSSLQFALDQVNSDYPDEEFCIYPSSLPNNKTIYGLWEWLETKNGVYHHTQASFFNVNVSLSPSPVQNSTFFVNNSNVGGCWGYTDFVTNQVFRGYYTGLSIYEERGWIGFALQTGYDTASAIFYMRIGDSSIEERIVGYYLLPGRGNPAGFQVLSNSFTPGNPAVGCPILARNACPDQSSSSSGVSSLNGLFPSLLKSF